ncbi:MAG: hypothetical protein IPJ74_23825 [Saprospiraceae bacterium]|nr:hypothetical protein [Saprospiraceae bacterium]
MKQISLNSGAGEEGLGFFIDAKPEELEVIIDNIFDSIINTYRILWKSQITEPNKDVNTEIQVNFEDRSGRKYISTYPFNYTS